MSFNIRIRMKYYVNQGEGEDSSGQQYLAFFSVTREYFDTMSGTRDSSDRV